MSFVVVAVNKLTAANPEKVKRIKQRNDTFSREMPTVVELQRENRLLRERLECSKRHTKTTGEKTVRVSGTVFGLVSLQKL